MVTLPAEVKKSLVLTDLQARTCEGEVVLLFKHNRQGKNMNVWRAILTYLMIKTEKKS